MKPPTLTERERQVLERLGRGMSRKDVAAELGISVKSVDTYMQRAFETYGVSNIIAAVLRMLSEQWS